MDTTIKTTYPYETTSPGVARHQCTECGSWERADKGEIRHGRKCESRAQGVTVLTIRQPALASGLEPLTATQKEAIRQGSISAVLSDDEIVERVRLGHVSVSDAMNRDF